MIIDDPANHSLTHLLKTEYYRKILSEMTDEVKCVSVIAYSCTSVCSLT